MALSPTYYLVTSTFKYPVQNSFLSSRPPNCAPHFDALEHFIWTHPTTEPLPFPCKFVCLGWPPGPPGEAEAEGSDCSCQLCVSVCQYMFVYLAKWLCLWTWVEQSTGIFFPTAIIKCPQAGLAVGVKVQSFSDDQFHSSNKGVVSSGSWWVSQREGLLWPITSSPIFLSPPLCPWSLLPGCSHLLPSEP